MSLQLIIGSSGSGKSYRMYQDIIRESMEHPEKKYLILVPEQFTLQTQKNLVALHPAHGIMNIDVLSFQRLAYHVFDEVGGSRRMVLEDTGKNLVLRRLAQHNKEKFKVLGGKLERMGYISEMKSILSELAQYNVSSRMLEEAAGQAEDNRMLQDKLYDIGLLQEEFRKYREGSCITAEEVLEELCKVAEYSEKLRNSVIALDGFTGFTPIQYLLLEKLMKCADKMLVTITMDVREYPFFSLREEELFALSKQTIWELRRLADEGGIREEQPILLSDDRRTDPELQFLERHLLRYDGREYKEHADHIRVTAAADAEEEILYTAREVRRLVKEEGYRYRDIAVITGDMEAYCHYVERHFEDGGIPCFIDYKRDILSNPFIEFLRAVLQMLDENFSYDSVFRYLRSGLSGIGRKEIDSLDNYCRALGIRGYRKYCEEWTRTYQGQREGELEALNQTRITFLEQIKELKECYAVRKLSVRQRTEGLYRWCLKLRIQEQLKTYETAFYNENRRSMAKEYAQIYRIVMDLFDKMADLIGDEVISLKDYREILDAGFEEAKVGIIPPGTDQVMIGDMERTRLKDIRILFFVGVNDGIIPLSKDRGGILSQLDRECLKASRIHLAPDRKENAWIQQFYLYMYLTKPSERLYISYSKRGHNGDVMRPSYLIGMLQELFPLLKTEAADMHTEPEQLFSERQAFLQLAKAISNETLDSDAAHKIGAYFLEQQGQNNDIRKLLQASGEQPSELALDKAVARALYGEDLVGSVTRLERYASCAYAHFLSYGLRLKERPEYTFATLDMGNILHKALEVYTERLERSTYDWFDIPQDDQMRLIDDCVQQVAEEYGNTILLSNARNAYMIDRMKQMGRKTVWALTRQVRRGKFIPRGFEVAFTTADHLKSVSYLLKDGSRLKLTGRVDRTDICETEDEVYVKVIDYKTGSQKFDPADVYYGLSLQLTVYLNVAMDMEKRTHKDKVVIPAAMLYYQMKDPILETDAELTEEAMKDAFLKELCTKGLVNSSPDVITLLDSEMNNEVPVIPASKTKSGALSARSQAASTGQIALLSEHVHDKIRQFGEEIMGGNISIRPYRKSGKDACEYCRYKAICGFDLKREGFAYRNLKPFAMKELWEKLAEKGEE